MILFFPSPFLLSLSNFGLCLAITTEYRNRLHFRLFHIVCVKYLIILFVIFIALL